MTLDEAKKIISENDTFKEITDAFKARQPYPDAMGGSGLTIIEYWLDDEGNKQINIIDHGAIHYVEKQDNKITNRILLYPKEIAS